MVRCQSRKKESMYQVFLTSELLSPLTSHTNYRCPIYLLPWWSHSFRAVMITLTTYVSRFPPLSIHKETLLIKYQRSQTPRCTLPMYRFIYVCQQMNRSSTSPLCRWSSRAVSKLYHVSVKDTAHWTMCKCSNQTSLKPVPLCIHHRFIMPMSCYIRSPDSLIRCSPKYNKVDPFPKAPFLSTDSCGNKF